MIYSVVLDAWQIQALLSACEKGHYYYYYDDDYYDDDYYY